MKALLFPGQGSQYVGMGKSVYDKHQFAKDLFSDINDFMGYSLSSIIFEGQKEDLTQTKNAQPALLCINYLMLRVFLEETQQDIKNFNCVAGHSLGEYSALLAANVLSFFDALKLVKLRGETMQKVSGGSMAAILGISYENLEECMPDDQACVIANDNAPGQIIVSGSKDSVSLVIEKAKKKGAKRALFLPVSGAFHSPYMQEASDKMLAYIKQTKFNTPSVTVYMNVEANPLLQEGDIKTALSKQICGRVRWRETINNMVENKVSEFYEIGPGNVLTGLIKKIAPDFQTFSYDK